LRAIEHGKKGLGIDNPLDIGLCVLESKELDLTGFDSVEIADLLGISRFEVMSMGTFAAVAQGDTKVRTDAEGDMQVSGDLPIDLHVQDLRQAPRCERSWKRDGTVALRADGGMLTDRDWEAVASLV
jgi:isoleucyl-tRNA synthetase